jgi:hypothetical protein
MWIVGRQLVEDSASPADGAVVDEDQLKGISLSVLGRGRAL